MSALRDELPVYLATRRALGAQLREHAGALGRFLDFMEREGADRITPLIALRWAQLSPGIQAASQARRLGMVRQFAAWCSASDPRTEIPPSRLIRCHRRRPIPHIFTEAEIERLMAAAGRLRSRAGLRPHTYSTLIGLLAAAGLRPGEAVALDRADVDLTDGIITIRQSKFGKSRIVPICETTQSSLATYAKHRDQVCSHPQTDAFFIYDRGGRLARGTTRRTFARMCMTIGLRQSMPGKRIGRGPRLQDLRHTFATRRLVEWYRAGADVGRKLPALATYLGHGNVVDTYWYIQAVPELLHLATERSTARSDQEVL